MPSQVIISEFAVRAEEVEPGRRPSSGGGIQVGHGDGEQGRRPNRVGVLRVRTLWWAKYIHTSNHFRYV